MEGMRTFLSNLNLHNLSRLDIDCMTDVRAFGDLREYPEIPSHLPVSYCSIALVPDWDTSMGRAVASCKALQTLGLRFSLGPSYFHVRPRIHPGPDVRAIPDFSAFLDHISGLPSLSRLTLKSGNQPSHLIAARNGRSAKWSMISQAWTMYALDYAAGSSR